MLEKESGVQRAVESETRINNTLKEGVCSQRVSVVVLSCLGYHDRVSERW